MLRGYEQPLPPVPYDNVHRPGQIPTVGEEVQQLEEAVKGQEVKVDLHDSLASYDMGEIQEIIACNGKLGKEDLALGKAALEMSSLASSDNLDDLKIQLSKSVDSV